MRVCSRAHKGTHTHTDADTRNPRRAHTSSHSPSTEHQSDWVPGRAWPSTPPPGRFPAAQTPVPKSPPACQRVLRLCGAYARGTPRTATPRLSDARVSPGAGSLRRLCPLTRAATARRIRPRGPGSPPGPRRLALRPWDPGQQHPQLSDAQNPHRARATGPCASVQGRCSGPNVTTWGRLAWGHPTRRVCPHVTRPGTSPGRWCCKPASTAQPCLLRGGRTPRAGPGGLRANARRAGEAMATDTTPALPGQTSRHSITQVPAPLPRPSSISESTKTTLNVSPNSARGPHGGSRDAPSAAPAANRRPGRCADAASRPRTTATGPLGPWPPLQGTPGRPHARLRERLHPLFRVNSFSRFLHLCTQV